MRVTVKYTDLLWRPLTDSDVDTRFVVEVRSNPRFAGLFYNSQISAEGHRNFIRAPQREDEINWLIERDGQPLGVASIYHLDRTNKKAECGRTIMLEPRVFSQSFVVSAFIAFGVMNLNKLWIETLEENRTIARGVERLGMTREGLLREHVVRDGKAANVWYFGALASEWRGASPTHWDKWGGTPELVSFEGWKTDK